MKKNVAEALASANETKALQIGSNILHRLPKLFGEQFGEKSAIVVCDATTWEVAGSTVQKQLISGGVSVEEPFVFDNPKPYAEFGNVLKLEEILNKSEAIPVVVGSGTLNDLTKLASSRTNRQYLCVATAASMDGYTAYGASITYQGAKQTFSCPAPQAVLADIEIIRNAPSLMTAAGYADLFAKIPAGADWILADALGVEAIDKKAWSIVQDGLKDALADPKGAKEGKEDAITPLVEGLMLGGFAMQWSKTSRPASGAEHQFSHLWNMEHHTHQGETPSHGFQVGVATLAVTRLYEKLLESPVEQLDVEACCKMWPDWEELEKNAVEMFQDTDFLETAITQSKDKYISKEGLAAQLEKLKVVWPELKEKLKNQLVPSDKLEESLQLVGAPVTSEQIGISKERMKSSFFRAWHIRSRFTVLDVAVRTGWLDKWLDELY
ncbi:MAG: sn-glycerol-1-phosphate dehydrogenase [Porphyromonadaceae bacterium]|nr:sn-glycerol-1-phosphate dehydrogenase [Porphyromonadaceae bacterium]